MCQFVQCTIDERTLVVVEKGAGQFDIFGDHDFAGDVEPEHELVAARPQDRAQGCIEARQAPAG